MIHELLLALSGYPGAAFTWSKRGGLQVRPGPAGPPTARPAPPRPALTALSTPQVSQELPFLHPSETSVLNRLCRLGTDYIRFAEFVEQYTGHVQQQVGPPLRSVSRAERGGCRSGQADVPQRISALAQTNALPRAEPQKALRDANKGGRRTAQDGPNVKSHAWGSMQ